MKKDHVWEDTHYKVDQWLIPHCYHSSAPLAQFHKAEQFQQKDNPNGNTLGPSCESWP